MTVDISLPAHCNTRLQQLHVAPDSEMGCNFITAWQNDLNIMVLKEMRFNTMSSEVIAGSGRAAANYYLEVMPQGLHNGQIEKAIAEDKVAISSRAYQIVLDYKREQALQQVADVPQLGEVSPGDTRRRPPSQRTR